MVTAEGNFVDKKTQNWKLELELEITLRQQLSAIGENGPEKERTKAARLWFAQVSKILGVCVEKSLSGKSEDFDIVPPAHVFIVLRSLADDLGRGIIPQVVDDVSKQGHPKKPRRMENHIGYATAYLDAVKRGVIAEKKPNKVVREAYGVSAQCVRNWAKLPIPKNVMPSLNNPKFLKRKMLSCGEHYEKLGPGLGPSF